MQISTRTSLRNVPRRLLLPLLPRITKGSFTTSHISLSGLGAPCVREAQRSYAVTTPAVDGCEAALLTAVDVLTGMSFATIVASKGHSLYAVVRTHAS